MAINKTSFLNSIKKGIPKAGGTLSAGGLFNPVGKSAAVVNKALEAEKSATLLKSKLGMEQFKSGMQALGKKDAARIGAQAAKKPGLLSKAGSAVKAIGAKTVSTGLGLGAVGAAAGYGAYRIMKAGKEARNAIDEQMKAQEAGSKMAVEATKKLIEQRKKKFVPTKAAGTLTTTLRKTLEEEAPETLKEPVRSKFSSQEAYAEAVRKFIKHKNWASEK